MILESKDDGQDIDGALALRLSVLTTQVKSQVAEVSRPAEKYAEHGEQRQTGFDGDGV